LGDMDLTIKKIECAKKIVSGIVRLTPLDYSGTFSRLTRMNLYLKLENMQKTGSFKIRGAYNKIFRLSDQQKSRGVIAASAGNHAQGVAYAASVLGLKATIVMPEGSPISKISASRGYGAEVILAGRDYDESFDIAGEMQKKSGATFIHGFDDVDIIAGQGTLGLEILDQMPRLDAMIVPVGGGGLVSGILMAVKSLRPQVKIYGVQSAGAPAVYLYRKCAENLDTPVTGTIAEGICVRRPGTLNLEIIRKYVDDVALVSDEEIAQAILMLLERSKIIAEGAGAAALASLISGKLDLTGQNVVVVVSGGNIDVNVLAAIIEKGLVLSGRRLRLRTVISDRPGSLQKVLAQITFLQANIISIAHDRSKPGVSVKDAEIEIAMETMNSNHVDNIREAFIKAGYPLLAD